jgi:hypothetical protein
VVPQLSKGNSKQVFRLSSIDEEGSPAQEVSGAQKKFAEALKSQASDISKVCHLPNKGTRSKARASKAASKRSASSSPERPNYMDIEKDAALNRKKTINRLLTSSKDSSGILGKIEENSEP